MFTQGTVYQTYQTTHDEVHFKQLHSLLPWIAEKLGAETSDELIRFENNKLDAIKDIILKKTVCSNQPTVIAGRQNRFSQALGEKLINCELHPGIDTVNLRFFPASSNGDWTISSEFIVAKLEFEGLDCPVVFNRTLTQSGFSWHIEEFICKKSDLHAVVSYLQKIEQTVPTVSLNRVDADTQEVEPLTWEDLILDPNITSLVKHDFESFLSKKEWFLSKHLPYRRGYLFHGPPGNGKTSVIRAMMTTAKLPTYTMKKFNSNESESNFETMFEMASKNDNAIILLEDIDRIFATKEVNKDSERVAISYSTFLNCLNGVADADGLIIIATANNPKALDPAILERPGRFDRVCGFPNPDANLRCQYYLKLNPEFDSDKVREAFNGQPSLSFAQLKEIYILAYQIAEQHGREISEADLGVAAVKMLQTNVVKVKSVGYGNEY